MDRLLTVHPVAIAAFAAYSTAVRLRTGRDPGMPRHTGHVCVLGGAPKRVGHPQKIFVFVLSCAWTSRPITASYAAGIRYSPALSGLLAGPVSRRDHVGEEVVVLVEGDFHGLFGELELV